MIWRQSERKVDNIEKFIFQQQKSQNSKKLEKRLYHIEEVLMLNRNEYKF